MHQCFSFKASQLLLRTMDQRQRRGKGSVVLSSYLETKIFPTPGEAPFSPSARVFGRQFLGVPVLLFPVMFCSFHVHEILIELGNSINLISCETCRQNSQGNTQASDLVLPLVELAVFTSCCPEAI